MARVQVMRESVLARWRVGGGGSDAAREGEAANGSGRRRGGGSVAGAEGDTRQSQYELTFIVDGHAMRHRYTEDTDASFPGIVTGPDGRFTIHDSDLLLSYEWVREEEVCWDECVAYETVCDTFEQEVCDVCTFEE